MQGMRGWFAMKRWGGNPIDARNRKHLLSFVSPTDLSVIEDVQLPFGGNESIVIGSCGRLLYIFGATSTIVIWDSATKTMPKIFPPPLLLPNHRGWVIFAGLGYDAKSGDYKLVRYYVQFYAPPRRHVTKDMDTDTDMDMDMDTDTEDEYDADTEEFSSDVFSFKHCTRKMLKKPIADISPRTTLGVYLVRTGRCYWVVLFPGLPEEQQTCVLSFDFASEVFEHFPLPNVYSSENFKRFTALELFQFRGCLGALSYKIPIGSSPLAVAIYAGGETGWVKHYDVSFDNIYRPLSLKDDRFLFLVERLNHGLVVYDLVTGTSEKVDINSSTGFKEGIISYDETTAISYAEATDPDSIPVAPISPTPSEEKEKQKQKQKEKEEEAAEEKKEKEKEKKKKEKEKKEKEKWLRDWERGWEREEEMMKCTQVASHSRICSSQVKARRGIGKADYLPLADISLNS